MLKNYHLTIGFLMDFADNSILNMLFF